MKGCSILRCCQVLVSSLSASAAVAAALKSLFFHKKTTGEFILEDSFFEGFVDYFDALFKQVVIFRNVNFAGGCNFEAEGRGVQPPAYNEYVKENVTGCLTQTTAHG